MSSRSVVGRVLMAGKLTGVVPVHFLYMLKCADGSLYTGYTTDPGRRLRQHNSGRASKYTRARLPVVLAYLESAPSRSTALRREFEIKKMNRAAKLSLCDRFRSQQAHSSR
jgi:putative endonuclease